MLIKEKIIYFDGFCVLCNNFIKQVIAYDKDKKFKFSMIGGERYTKLVLNNPDLKKIDSVIYQDGTETYFRGEAVRKVIQELSSSAIVNAITKMIPLFLLNFYYSLVATSRYKIFGKYDVCPPLPPEWRDRFLP